LYADYLPTFKIDGNMTSFRRLPTGRNYDFLGIWHSQPTWPQRAIQIVSLLHDGLAPLIGRALASASDPSPSDLTPRLQQVLLCLVEGDSEKEVAARLTLSPLTVHEYVKRIYHHFGATTRAELMAFLMRRHWAAWAASIREK
jgi:DNA-binding NarL/FixJ family response regulator